MRFSSVTDWLALNSVNLWLFAIVVIGTISFYYVFNVPFVYSIVLGFILSVFLFLGSMAFTSIFYIRQPHSGDADFALQRIIDELRPSLLKKYEPILQVEGIWSNGCTTWVCGYPRIAILFSTEDELRQIVNSDALDWVSSKLAETIQNDTRFGRNRRLYSKKNAVYATADEEKFWRLIAKSSV